MVTKQDFSTRWCLGYSWNSHIPYFKATFDVYIPQHKYSTEKKADIVVVSLSYSFISVELKDINYDFQIPLRSPAEE